VTRRTPDVVIIGAGIIGLSLALELQRSGVKALVLDRSEPAREASFAGAGMLAAADITGPPPLVLMAKRSAGMYARFVAGLEEASGAGVDFRRTGAIVLGRADHGQPLSHDELRHLEPGLAWRGQNACFLQEDCVDPRTLIRALLRAARRRGVTVRGECPVRGLIVRSDTVQGVRSDRGDIPSRVVVNCAGAWAGRWGLRFAPTRPVRGHLIACRPEAGVGLRHVVRHRPSDVYLLPRSDGRVIAGSTIEEAGFRKTVDPSVARSLHQAAARILPALARATIVERWTGLRPGSPDELPILGPTPIEGYYVATGHYRNGILLAPVTARLMAQAIKRERLEFDLRPFSPARFLLRSE
jgi:glycine oxidase